VVLTKVGRAAKRLLFKDEVAPVEYISGDTNTSKNGLKCRQTVIVDRIEMELLRTNFKFTKYI
jgi:hypothetical protein